MARARGRDVVLARRGAVALIALCLVVTVLSADQLKPLAEYESSPIDWCESNYAVHTSIAEFWNSASSIPIALVAPVAYAQDAVPARIWQELSKVQSIFLLVILIGVGSTYFHATLSVFGQIMDEMSIIWLTLYAAVFVMPRGRSRWLTAVAFERPVLAAFVLFTTLLGLLSPLLSHVFVLSCVPFGLVTLIGAYRRSTNEDARRRFRVALRFFAAAVACWLVDKFACPQVEWVGRVTGIRPQLHAVWHLLVSVVAFILISVCCEFREEIQFGIAGRRLPGWIRDAKGRRRTTGVLPTTSLPKLTQI